MLTFFGDLSLYVKALTTAKTTTKPCSSSQFIYRINLDKNTRICYDTIRTSEADIPPCTTPLRETKGLNIAPNQHQLKLKEKKKKLLRLTPDHLTPPKKGKTIKAKLLFLNWKATGTVANKEFSCFFSRFL